MDDSFFRCHDELFYVDDEDVEHSETDEYGAVYYDCRLLYFKEDAGPICVIREGTKVICHWAFRNYNRKLQKIVIPESMVAIDRTAFSYCQGVEVINHSKYFRMVDNMLIDKYEHIIIGYFGLDDEVVIPKTVKSIENAFLHSGIRKITIPHSIKRTYSFSMCENLQTVVLPDNLVEISGYAFNECQMLQDITIPDSVKIIGDKAFAGCRSLREIDIPASVRKIGENPFTMSRHLAFHQLREWYCKGSNGRDPIVRYEIKVTSQSERFVVLDDMLIDTKEKRLIGYYGNAECVAIPDGIKLVGDNAFAYTKIRQVTIPDSVTKIGRDAFVNTQLQEVFIPDSVNEIGHTAFAACFSLKKVRLPKTLEEIGIVTFALCNKLQEINIPDSILTIGDGAFLWCKSLRQFNIPASTLRIGDRVFEHCDAITLTSSSTKFCIENNKPINVWHKKI